MFEFPMQCYCQQIKFETKGLEITAVMNVVVFHVRPVQVILGTADKPVNYMKNPPNADDYIQK